MSQCFDYPLANSWRVLWAKTCIETKRCLRQQWLTLWCFDAGSWGQYRCCQFPSSPGSWSGPLPWKRQKSQLISNFYFEINLKKMGWNLCIDHWPSSLRLRLFGVRIHLVLEGDRSIGIGVSQGNAVITLRIINMCNDTTWYKQGSWMHVSQLWWQPQKDPTIFVGI